MKNLPITKKFMPEFFKEMDEMDVEGVSTVGQAICQITDDAEALEAMFKYYDNHDYSSEDLKRMQRILAEISVYAEYAGNALADAERTMRKLE